MKGRSGPIGSASGVPGIHGGTVEVPLPPNPVLWQERTVETLWADFCLFVFLELFKKPFSLWVWKPILSKFLWFLL